MKDNQERKLKYAVNKIKIYGSKIIRATRTCIKQGIQYLCTMKSKLVLDEKQKEYVRQSFHKGKVLINYIYTKMKDYGKHTIYYTKVVWKICYQMLMKGIHWCRQKIQQRKMSAAQKEYIEKIRICFVADVDKEEAYLHEMSLQGLHFVKKLGIRYIFKKGEKSSCFYHVSYQEHEHVQEQEHIDTFTKNGWNHIYCEKAGLHGVWHYFSFMSDRKPNVKQDKHSHIVLYTRLLASMKRLITWIAICFILMMYLLYTLSTYVSSIHIYASTICWIVCICLLICLFMYGYLYRKTHQKLQHMSNI